MILVLIDTHYNDEFEGNYCNLVALNSIPESAPSFRIFPNPAQLQLQFSSDLTEMDVIIYNSLGAKVHTNTWSGASLDISHLQSGLYFIECRKDGVSLGREVLVRDR